jgi:hypothetical protein
MWVLSRSTRFFPVIALLLAPSFGACGGGSGGAGGGTTMPPVPVKLDITVAYNPNSNISCIVSWHTDAATTSEVQLGDTATYASRIHDDALVTDHRVTVVGMHAESAYHLRAVSRDGGGAIVGLSDDHVYNTGGLPATVVPAMLTKGDAAGVHDWTLVAVGYLSLPTAAVIYDPAGLPVWYAVSASGNTLGTALRVDDGVLLTSGNAPPVELDLGGNVLWTGPAHPAGTIAPGPFHHELKKLPSGNYAGLVGKIVNGVDGDVLLEIQPTGEIAWQWDAFAHLDTSAATGDWTHANSITVTLDEDVVYWSARNLSTVFKLDRKTGDILWRLGEGGDFAADPKAAVPWFSQQHDPELLPNGHVLVYDNGNMQTRPYSRVVEYALDEQAMTATLVWQYPPAGVDDVWYQDALGGVQRLDNGDTLITTSMIEGKPARIFEVTPAGETVWQLEVPYVQEIQSIAYRATRIAPLLEAIP